MTRKKYAQPVDVLDVTNFDRYRYRLTWYFTDVDDYGASLGETCYTQHDLETAIELDDGTYEMVGNRQHVQATIVVQDMRPKPEKDSDGFFWDSETEAREALRVVNTALKDGKVWPQWAITAKEAGWKPPKDWKP